MNNKIFTCPIYDSKYIECSIDTKTGELSYRLAPAERYVPYTFIEVLYEIPGRGFFRAKRKLSHYFIYKVNHDLRTGDKRDPKEFSEIIGECAMALARENAAFSFCHLGKVVIKEVRL